VVLFTVTGFGVAANELIVGMGFPGSTFTKRGGKDWFTAMDVIFV
jgi:hypothetical protein